MKYIDALISTLSEAPGGRMSRPDVINAVWEKRNDSGVKSTSHFSSAVDGVFCQYNRDARTPPRAALGIFYVVRGEDMTPIWGFDFERGNALIASRKIAFEEKLARKAKAEPEPHQRPVRVERADCGKPEMHLKNALGMNARVIRSFKVVAAVAQLAQDPNDWEEMRELPRIEILEVMARLSEWAINGDAVFTKWQTDMTARRADLLNRTFRRLNISSSFSEKAT